jgi:transcriptional regulator with XRE-family HTH domain
MRYPKKSPETLTALRRGLVERILREQPDIPEAARWIRESLGLNQRDFARLVGLSTPQVARLERGEVNPTLETLLAIGKPYGLGIGFTHPSLQQLLQPPGDAQTAQTALPLPPPARRRPRPLPPLSFTKPQDEDF